MIAAVNDAAETARLVMDQGLRRAERRGADDDGGSDGDDDGSEHSLHSQTTKTSGNAFGLGIDLTDGDYEDGMEFPITPRNGAGDDETGFAVDGDGAAGSPPRPGGGRALPAARPSDPGPDPDRRHTTGARRGARRPPRPSRAVPARVP
ncbi:hypothetical protein THAOC_13249 [Thalassiosira oceanica]|uniref:Uncharacterized protein n=1 Tax=Thalassiosira oceanica TaxID=159749 RepID=K0T5Z6_THAOC|nr:hypothetical protein THAOC_13249 [Thalassiosira oceanica]|eukprot:EJK65852.1 hypothetical protein THAOC_13249 [Thalassiosira oceanica]